MLRTRSRIAAALATIGLLYLNAGSVAMGVEVGGLLVGNAKSFRAVSDGRPVNIKSPTCLSDRHINALEDDAAVIASISFLRRPVSPAAIAWLIIPIAPDAVQAQPIRHFAHVGQEVFEPLPPLTDPHTLSTVPAIVFAALVLTPALHGYPARVSAGPGLPSTGMAVSGFWQIRNRSLSLEASA